MAGFRDITKQQAEHQGFIVDTTTYPWRAYKGACFQPDEWYAIVTPAVDADHPNPSMD